MITYNHAPYVAKAIESVLMQQVDFKYELLVGDDCSTDGSRDIIGMYASEQADVVKVLPRDRNLGCVPNFIDVLKRCKGQYIALLEGDDYWTDPCKLQKQVKHLDSRPEFMICGHQAIRVDAEGEPMDGVELYERKPVATLKDILEHNFLPTCSVVFRNKIASNLPAWMSELKQGDWPLHILNAQHGDIAFINEPMSAYRLHGQGIWSASSMESRWMERNHAALAINAHFNGRYQSILMPRVVKNFIRLSDHGQQAGDARLARRMLTRAIACKPTLLVTHWGVIKRLIRLSMPARGRLGWRGD